MLLICWPEMFMSQFAPDIQAVLRNYGNAFEVFYCPDEAVAKEIFNTKVMPREVPHLYLVDPNTKKEIKSRDGQRTLGTYLSKHQGFIFNISNPGEELTKFLDNFMDEKLDHHCVTEDRSQKTHVKWVNSDTFEQEIVKNPRVQHCVLEIIKDHCPACFIAKFNSNMITRKLQKHGLSD